MKKRKNKQRALSKGLEKIFLTDFKDHQKLNSSHNRKSTQGKLNCKLPLIGKNFLAHRHDMDSFIENFKKTFHKNPQDSKNNQLFP